MRADAATAIAKRKVFIVDDHPIVRQGLAALINTEPDLAVCGDAEDSGSALRRIEETQTRLGRNRYLSQRTGRPRSSQEHSRARCEFARLDFVDA